MVVKTYTFVGKSANCDLTSNWAPLKSVSSVGSVAGQRLYTIQRRSLVGVAVGRSINILIILYFP